MTLIEMLVTLALVGLLTTVLSQALGQIRRIEGLLDSGRLESQTRDLRLEWLRVALQAALPMPQTSPERLQGSASELSFATTQAPGPGHAQVARLRLKLQFDAIAGSTRLEVTQVGDELGLRPWTAAQWPGNSGRLRYLDARGAWRDAWPPQGQTDAALPAAVMVDAQHAEVPLLLAATGASPIPPPLRRDLEGL